MTSPYLNRPLRSEAEARRDRDDALIAGVLIAVDALRIATAAQQDRATSERGRLACAVVIDGCEQIRRRALLGEASS